MFSFFPQQAEKAAKEIGAVSKEISSLTVSVGTLRVKAGIPHPLDQSAVSVSLTVSVGTVCAIA